MPDQDDEDTKALILSLANAPDLDDEDRALIDSIKKDYGMVDEAPKKKGVLERMESAGTAFNQGVEDISNAGSEAEGPVERGIVLGAKGLKAVGEVGSAVGESADKGIDAVNKQIDKLPAGVSQFVKYNPMLQGPKHLLGAASMLAPRTSMQAAFALLTAPFEGLGGVAKAGKAMAGSVKTAAQYNAMGATRRVSEMYPKSKLAARLERFFAGSVGENKFNLRNKAATNTKIQELGKAHIADEEYLQAAKAEDQINQKLLHDVGEEQRSLKNVTELATQKKAELTGEVRSMVDANADKTFALRDAERAARKARKQALNSRRAQEAAVKADLAVDKAMGLLDKDTAGIHVGRQLDYAKAEAYNAVDEAYDKAHALGRLVTADTTSLNTTFATLRRDLAAKLKVNPEDIRAQKLLSLLEEGTGTLKHVTSEGLDAMMDNPLLPQATKTAAEKMAVKKPKSLSDLLTLYADLNTMGREKGDKVYLDAAELVRGVIREYEKVPWTKAVVDAWDSARKTRMDLDQAFENKTIEGVLKTAKEGDPAKLFDELFDKKSRMPLTNFMRAAPKEAQLIVRRESLRRGFDAIKVADGESSAKLAKWIEATGEGNVTLLHAGADVDGLKRLAEANDTIFNAEKILPGLKNDIKEIAEETSKLAEGVQAKIAKLEAAVQRKTGSVFDKSKKLQDQARLDVQKAQEEAVARIERNLKDLEKAFSIPVKASTRAGEEGKLIYDMERKEDTVGDFAVAGGAGAVAIGAGVTYLGDKTGNRTIRNIGATATGMGAAVLVAGMVKKSPAAMSEIYYSPKGRALMETIASAPSSKEVAIAILELGKTMRGGAYPATKITIDDKKPNKEDRPKANLGKLSGLQSRQAASGDGLDRLINREEPEKELPDEEYGWPVE